MQIVEDEADRVIADRIHLQDGDVLLARDRLALGGRMALHFGARASHPQIFGRKIEARASIEDDRQRLAVLMQAQLDRPRRLGAVAHQTPVARWPRP